MSKETVFEITGVIEEMSREERGISPESKPFVKRDFMVKTLERFPNSIAFTAWNTKVDDLSYYQLGGEITVRFKIVVNTHKGKNYNNFKIFGFGETNN